MFKKIFIAFVVVCSLGSICVLSFIFPKVNQAYKASKLFDLEKGLEVSEATIILDRAGAELGRAFIENRTSIVRSDVSQNLVDAILAVEDVEFYNHEGVFIKALIRATIQNIKIGGIAQGGSTITQQLAKHVINDSSRTVERKLLELFVALRLESEFRKDTILMFYLNRVFFGSGFYGIEAASRGFFGVPASQLSLAQASFLAGLVKAPSSLNPYKHMHRAKARQRVVLDRLVVTGALTPIASDALYAEKLELLPRFRKTIGVKSFPASKALQLVESELSEDLDIGEVIIHTTIDARLQDKLESLASSFSEQVAIGVLHKSTGELLGYVGGTNFLSSQYDRFFQINRSGGQIMAVEQAATFFNTGGSPASRLKTSANALSKILLQDSIALLDRPSLSTLFPEEELSPSEILQRYLLLSNTYAPITIVKGFQKSKVASLTPLTATLPPFPTYSKESAEEALSMLVEAGNEGFPFLNDGIYVSSSVGGFDGWGVAVKKDIIVVAWIGYDKPIALGGKAEIEKRMADMLKNLLGSTPNITPINTGLYVSRSTGVILPYSEKFAGSIFVRTRKKLSSPALDGPLYVQLPFFETKAETSLLRVKSNQTTIPQTRILVPAPRPAFISADGVTLVDSPMEEGNFLFMPRLESFSSQQDLQDFLDSLDMPNAHNLMRYRRGVPTMVSTASANTVKWPVYGRRYNYPEMYSILLGTAGLEQPTNTDKPKQDEPLFPLFRGRDGLELMCDKLTLTMPGYVTYTSDFLGYPQSADFKPPSAAPAIDLVINHAFQTAAVSAMVSVSRGAFVVMDVHTGDVVASVSKPLTDKLNRVTSAHFPPGSSFKPFTVLSTYMLDTSFTKFTQVELGNIILPGASFIFPKEVGTATLDMAMASSFNSYFMKLGMRQDPNDFSANLSMFGFGVRTGFFLGDIPGLVPTPSYVLDRHNRTMGEGDLANISIGQGDLLVTPIQMARAYAVIASRGVVISPKFLKSEPVIARPFLYGSEWQPWYDIDSALKAVVNHGTGRASKSAAFPSLRGKTGTAQIGPKHLNQLAAWFCGYFKYNDRTYSFATLVEGENFEDLAGGRNAAPVIGQFLRALDVNMVGDQEYVSPVLDLPKEEVFDLDDSQLDILDVMPSNGEFIDFGNEVDNILRRSLLLPEN